MKKGNLFVVGGLFALLMGVAKVISPILYLIMPAGLRAEVPAKTFLPAFAAQPDLLLAFFWVEALVGVFGLAIVPAVHAAMRGENEGWTSFGRNLATIGFGVSTVGYLLSIARLPAIAHAFVSDPSTQAVLSVTWKASIDLLGFWGYAAIGLWIFIVSLTALQHGLLPRWIAILGLVIGVPHLLIPIGAYFKIQAVLMAALLIGLAVPVWYIGLGLHLRKVAEQ